LAVRTIIATGISAGHRGGDKTPVIGAIERKGNVVARVLKRVTSQTMLDFVNETVSNKVSLLATDSARYYSDYLQKFNHATVDHSKGQYVIGAVHTNTIEGFWSIFKRGVVGTFHKMSAKYMPLYVAEFQFRYNNRNNPDMFGSAIAGC
jgi:IS1 family transposase